MRNISMLLLLPITIFASSTTAYESDVIIPQALQSTQQSSSIQENLTQTESLDPQTPVYIEKRLPLPTDDDIIIPKALQENPSSQINESTSIEKIPTKDPQSIAIERVINQSNRESDIIIPKALQKNPIHREITITTEVLTPKTAMPIHQSVEIPQIQGTYVLSRGVERNKEIVNAMLFIEKLDDNDFGYYYVTKINHFPASGLPGIFHYDIIKKRFVNKVKETEFTTKPEENIEIKYDGKQLETIMAISVGKRAIIWDKVPDNYQADPSIIKALRDTKEVYTQVYKNNKSFLLD